ncbi:MAG: polyphenol oxidase family protein [Candidatus Rokuibacteriota bacterium]
MSLVAKRESPAYFTFPSLTAIGVAHATTTRSCPGIASWSETPSPFKAEAAAALRPAGLDLERVAWARQVHGAAVARVGQDGGFAGVADVLVTTERGVPLAVFTADCLAVVLHAPGALAIAHVGWRGTVHGAAQAAVGALTAVGARPSQVVAAIAPSIGPCCYEVDEPVAERFEAAYPGRWAGWARAVGRGRFMLDLWTANEHLLREAGVPAGRIENARLCTACHPDVLYSYRKGNHGRLVTLAALV